MNRCLAVVALVALGATARAGTVDPSDLGVTVAGELAHEVWTVRDGLPVNAVTDVHQSRDGYLWLTTFDGLARFDGVTFAVYNASNARGLVSNRLTEIHEAPGGDLWLRTERGELVRYDRRDAAFLPAVPAIPPAATGHRAVVTRDGQVWLSTRPGLARWTDGRFVPLLPEVVGDLDVAVIEAMREDELWLAVAGAGLVHLRGGEVVGRLSLDGLGSGRVTALLAARDGTLWVGTDRGVGRASGTKLEPIEVDGVPWPAAVLQLVDVPGEGVVIGTRSGLFHLDPDVDGARPVQLDSSDRLPSPGRRLVAADRRGRVWIATASAVFSDGREVFRLPTGDRGRINGIAVDHEDSLWVATGSGLHRLRPALFEVWGEAEGLVGADVYPLHEDPSGAIWIGTQKGGLNRLRGGRLSALGTESGLASSYVRSILVDRRGAVWVGTYESGLFVGGEDGGFRRVPAVAADGASVDALFEDRRGRLWAGTSRGLMIRRDEAWQKMLGALGDVAVRVIAEDDTGTLWFGSNGRGLFRLDDETATAVGREEGLASDYVRALLPIPGGGLWVGTEDRGLCRLAMVGSTIQSLVCVGAADGLYENGIHQILRDDAGWLWMSTNRGVFRVREEQLVALAAGRRQRITSEAFTERDGLRNRECNGGVQGAGIRARDGRLYFATQDGVAVVDPRKTLFQAPPVPLVIESVVTARSRQLAAGGTVELALGDRSFSVTYAGLSLLAPERVRFRYRLDGFDDEWVEAEGRRQAFFTRVPPGTFTFRLEGTNSDGVWNRHGPTLTIVVPPFLWERASVRAIAVGLLVALLWLADRRRQQRRRSREERLDRLVVERTRELDLRRRAAEAARATIEDQAARLRELDVAKTRLFTNVSHELRTPLTLMKGPLEDLGRGRYGALDARAADLVEVARDNTDRLSELVDQLLDAARIDAGMMRLERRRSDLRDLLLAADRRFRPLAERRGLALELGVPEQPVVVEIDRDQLAKVVDNLLSNACKLTPGGGSVRLDLATGEDVDGGPGWARVCVADTGPGIPESQLPHVFERFYQADDGVRAGGTGIGLALASELAKLHGGSLEVTSAPGEGATFALTLPLADDVTEEPIAVLEGDPLAPREGVPPLPPRLDGSGGPRATAAPAAGEDDEEADRTTVLVVDDHPDIRAFVRGHLEGVYRVLEAADGLEALSQARSALPDLVISDVMMPALDGFELVRALRAEPALDWIPVILLTARAAIEDRLHGLGLEADDYLVKPFDARELRARVDNLIASRRRLRQRFAATSGVAPGPSPPAASADERYLDRLRAVIDERLGDPQLNVAELARAMAQDRTHLFRRVRELTGKTPSELLRERRLERAAELLGARAGRISEIGYSVGFQSMSHFSQRFRERFGVTPSEFLDRGGGVDRASVGG